MCYKISWDLKSKKTPKLDKKPVRKTCKRIQKFPPFFDVLKSSPTSDSNTNYSRADDAFLKNDGCRKSGWDRRAERLDPP